MSFSQAVRHVFVNYVNFKGRASRSEYWWFYLFFLVISLALWAIAMPLGWTSEGTEVSIGAAVLNIPEVPSLVHLWSLAVLLPGLALSTRRLHDAGKSDWNLLWFFAIPLCGLGAIVLLYFLTRPSAPGPNRYGDGPATAGRA